jgi:VWFA-related protein
MASRVSSLTLVATAMLLAAPAALPALQQRDARQHQAIASVVDKDGKPIEGLSVADFVVREDGTAREVLKVENATTPMQIVLLADTSGGMQLILPDLRKGLEQFAGTLWRQSPDSEIALMEYGERPNQVAGFSKTFDVLDHGIKELNEHSGSGAYLLEAILEAANLLKKKEATRPIIVAFDNETSREFSNQTYQQVEETLQKTKTVLWSVELHSSGGGGMSEEVRNRNVVLGDSTRKSGGTRDTLIDRMGIESKLTEMADRLASQYLITYGRPDRMIPPSKLEITVKRPGAQVWAPHWTGQ